MCFLFCTCTAHFWRVTQRQLILTNHLTLSQSFIFTYWSRIRSYHFMANRWGNNENSEKLYFGGSKITPLQYSCLENPMDGGAWWATVHGVAKSQTRLSYFTFTFHFHALEKEMATHSNVLAWRIPGTGEPGGLPSMGLHRVRHDWSDLAAAAAGAIIVLMW